VQVRQVVSGARVPADGEVVEGRSYVDESMVTGESKPLSKRPGDAVISGTVNGSAPLIVKVALLPIMLLRHHALL
jgi:P-type E1-E2 ATPase